MRKIVISFLMLAAWVNATIYYVRPTNGSDGNAGTSFAVAFQTTQKALDTAIAGDIIRLIPEATEEITAQIDVDTNAGTASNPIVIQVGNTTDGSMSSTLTYEIKATASITAVLNFTEVADHTRWTGVILNANSQAINAMYNNVDGSDSHVFNRCVFQNGTRGIYIRNITTWYFIACVVENNSSAGITPSYSSATRGLFNLTGCIIRNNGSYGIGARSAMTLRCCLIYKNGGDGIQMLQSSAGNDISCCTIADNAGDGIELYNNVSFTGHRIVGNQLINNGGYGINLYAMTQYVMYSFEGNNIYNNTSGAASVTIDAWPYTTYDPKFVNTEVGSEDYRIKSTLYTGFPTAANGILTGACTAYNGSPALSDVKSTASVDGVAGTLDMSLYTLISGLVGPEWVVFGHDLRSGVPGEFRASDFANCTAENIKKNVTIDDVTGSYEGTGGGGGASKSRPFGGM